MRLSCVERDLAPVKGRFFKLQSLIQQSRLEIRLYQFHKTTLSALDTLATTPISEIDQLLSVVRVEQNVCGLLSLFPFPSHPHVDPAGSAKTLC